MLRSKSLLFAAWISADVLLGAMGLVNDARGNPNNDETDEVEYVLANDSPAPMLFYDEKEKKWKPSVDKSPAPGVV